MTTIIRVATVNILSDSSWWDARREVLRAGLVGGFGLLATLEIGGG